MFQLNSHPGIIHLTVYSKLIARDAQWEGGWGVVIDHGFPTQQSIRKSDEGDILNLAKPFSDRCVLLKLHSYMACCHSRGSRVLGHKLRRKLSTSHISLFCRKNWQCPKTGNDIMDEFKKYYRSFWAHGTGFPKQPGANKQRGVLHCIYHSLLLSWHPTKKRAQRQIQNLNIL